MTARIAVSPAMTVEQGAHKGGPYLMSIPVGATLVVGLLRRLRIQPVSSKGVGRRPAVN
jgi:hypothetical protein